MEVNGLTDDTPDSSKHYAQAAISSGLVADVWELTNEPSYFSSTSHWVSPFWVDATGYADKMKGYHDNLLQGDPKAHTAIFYAGQYFGSQTTWDPQLFTYNGGVPYWDRAAVHVYTNTPDLDNNYSGYDAEHPYSNKQYYQNYILSSGTNGYYDSYFSALSHQNILIDITEFNGSGHGDPFISTWYNGIFISEYIARLSSDPLIEKVGIQALYLKDDASSLLLAQNNAPGPGGAYGFSLSAPGVAVSLLNQALNSSTHWYPTTVESAPSDTVPTVVAGTLPAQFGTPIPSVFAQAYLGDDGTHYVFITNKSPNAETVTLSIKGATLPSSVSVATASSADPSSVNLPGSGAAVAAQPSVADPVGISVPGYAVALVSW
jgi:hypothetical protein